MIKVDGYKAFRGTMKISAIHIDTKTMTRTTAPFEVYGDWLYKPEAECWYAREVNKTYAGSYPAEICEIIKDETDFGD